MTKFNHSYLAIILSFLVLSLYSCNSNEPDSPGKDPSETDVKFENDLLNGKYFYYLNLSDLTSDNYLIDSKEPVDLLFDDESENIFGIGIEEKNGVQYLKVVMPNGFQGGRYVMGATMTGKKSGQQRHVVFIVDDDLENSDRDYSSETDDDLERALRQRLGKGTVCFLELGNGKNDLLLRDVFPMMDNNLVFRQRTPSTDMDEIHEHSFKSMSEKWAFNLGLSGAYQGFSGAFNFGMQGSKRTTNDYEYYMCYIKAKCMEGKINMVELERMATRNPETAQRVISFFPTSFMVDILETPVEKLDSAKFFGTWGTDMVYQASLGGQCSFIFSREENTNFTSIGADIKAKVAYEMESKKDDKVDNLYKLILSLTSKPELQVEGKFDFSYNKENYNSASHAELKYRSEGGNNSNGDFTKWIEGLQDSKDSDKWVVTSYKISSDPTVSSGNDWYLYPIDQLAAILVNAVETEMRAKSKFLAREDSIMLVNARDNIKKLERSRKDYIDQNSLVEEGKSNLVICDVMMKHQSPRRSGGPEPFVAPDPRDNSKYRTYYPMMANNNFNNKAHTAKMRGKGLDTNDDHFVSAVHYGSHYWYYALAHENDCDGIADIKFLTEEEARESYPFYTQRGDDARNGLGGLLVHKRHVYVKFIDPSDSKSKKITAFGLWDDSAQSSDSQKEKHVFASSGGAEYFSVFTESEYKKFKNFWTTDSVMKSKGNLRFYQGAAATLNHFFPVYSKEPLPLLEESAKYKDLNSLKW